MYHHGFQAASLDRILSNTQLTKGALYHHFPNKRAMGMAVVDEVIRGRIYRGIVEPLEQTDDPIPILEKVIDSQIGRSSEESMRLGCPLNNLSQEMSPLDDEFRGHLQNVFESWRMALAAALKRGQAKGNIREDVNCEQAALFIIAIYEGSIGLGKAYQSRDLYRDCAAQLKTYLNALRA
jgi:AcrR family transcriptional regulator